MFNRIKKIVDWRLKVSQQIYIQLFTLLNLALYSGPFLRYFLQRRPMVSQLLLHLLLPLFYLLAIMLLNIVFAALFHGWSTKVLSVLILMTNSLCLYLMNIYRIQVNSMTMVNVFRIGPKLLGNLISRELVLYMLYMGLLPSLLVIFVIRIERETGDWMANIGFGSVSLLVIALVVGPSLYFRVSRTFLLVGNAHTLNYLMPINYMGNFVYLCGAKTRNMLTRRKSGAVDQKAKIRGKTVGNRKNLVVLVIGNSARSQNFSMNGYRKKTNEPLEKLNVISYKNVSSCGTSAVHSIPCIFSSLSRDKFRPLGGKTGENLLDILRDVGFDVKWRSTRGGCLGLCAKGEYLSTMKMDKSGLDKSLLIALNRDIKQLKGRNTVIVLNQTGSQEPFYRRYPANFGRFTPVCGGGSGRCSLVEAVNSYDNTLYYSSYNVGRVINMLKKGVKDHNIVLIYVSDHGYGLGEDGLWGHSMAYEEANEYVTRVPMLLWFSSGSGQGFRVSESCLRNKLSEKLSHDNIFHSLLGLFNIESKQYDKNLDLFRSCRI
ncbi:MAG: sulfatase-like hydrolase/transferase [Rickettsiales bacterium]|jgi:lipid A ethanolaminephosphotransferase|nr:sulfatase-like hydrolase/transferase [Rickettsiales bacterium]